MASAKRQGTEPGTIHGDIADVFDIDFAKLEKLEKMIVRVDADVQRMQRGKDKLLVVETLKKVTHQLPSLPNIARRPTTSTS